MKRNCRNEPRFVESVQSRFERAGLTFLEVAVLLVALAVLIAVVAPMLGAATQRAHLESDLHDLRAHGVATAQWGMDYADTLPNQPESPGFENPAHESMYGERGTIAHRFGTEVLPYNGWQFKGQGDATPGIGFIPLSIFSTYGMNNTSPFSASSVILGPYLAEHGSVYALEEVFLSAADNGRRAIWDNWKYSFRTGQPASDGINYAPAGAGTLPATSTAPPANSMCFGSYMYSMSGFVQPEAFTVYVSGLGEIEYIAYIQSNAYTSQPPNRFNFASQTKSVVERNPTARVAYPSNKALFYTVYNLYDSPALGTYWFQPGVTSTVALADGSVRAVVSSREAVQRDDRIFMSLRPDYGNAIRPGALLQIQIFGGGQYPAYYSACYGGILGRDL